VHTTVTKGGYRFAFQISPNRAAIPDTFTVDVSKGGRPVRGADILVNFNQLDMEMPAQEFRLRETAPGRYSISAPALVMVGHWALSFDATVAGRPLSVVLVDHAQG
jgi:hypothetical protein